MAQVASKALRLGSRGLARVPQLHARAKSIDYEAAVEEALCFGWVDSLVRRLDDDRYARKFTPRNADSRLVRDQPPALREPRGTRAPRAGGPRAAAYDTQLRPRASIGDALPAYIEKALKANARAWQEFQRLAPSYRRSYVGWIDSAKKAETKARRIEEAIRRLAAGEKLGLK